ncbi:XrtA/PEP-CTERM system TPR-repeat protein PrsT [Rubrivivax albus]|uniref:XrtA/PEP-CTERM system TPR-repeat protein PrsT n=1 Tax=Rubrivivax albus TaxID=2499835 RepID=UPI00130537FB|nr:XrtA/PEP-CTERM system TPR-repeat protein PrsT [Rubrivivax albus]
MFQGIGFMAPRMSRSLRGLVALSVATAAALAGASPERAAQFYEDARSLYDKRDLPAAAIQLKNALQQDGNMLAAHLLLGKVLFEAGQLNAAEVALDEALKRGVNRSEVMPVLGRVYLRLGEPAKLLDRVDTAGVPPELHADILTMRGSAEAMAGKLSTASATFERARRANPKSAEPLVAEAPMLLRYGQVQRALEVASAATKLEPGNAMAWHQLGNIQQALGDMKAALDAQERATALAPKFVDAHVARATVLIAVGRTADARALLEQLKTWKVSEPRASYLRATLLAEAGDMAAATESWREAADLIDVMPSALRASSEPLLFAGALSHRALGNLQKAREYLDILLGRNPRHFAGRAMQASFLLAANEFAKAKPVVDELLRQAPEEPQILYLAGQMSLARREYEQATEFFERAQSAGAGNMALRDLALSQFAQGQGKVALANLERAYAKDAKDTRAGIELAVAYARLGQGRRAVDLAQKLVARQPDDPVLINFLGNIHGRLGDRANMRVAFERALATAPDYRPTVINLSRLDLDENRPDAARARLQAWVKGHEKDVEALYYLGVAERSAGRMVQALEAWERATGADRRDPRSAMATVDVLIAQGRTDQAVTVARAMAVNVPNVVPVQHVLARAYAVAGQRDAARSALKEALKLAGFEPGPIVQTGRMMLQVGDLDSAGYAALKALQASPDALDAMLLSVEVAARRGDAAAVDKGMAELTARHRNATPVLVTAGHVAMSRRQYTKAIASYQQAYEKEPSTPIALLRSRAQVAAGQPAAALSGLLDARRKSPDDDTLLRAIAEVRVLAGKPSDAVRDFEALVVRRPTDAELHGSFAEVLFALKDPRAIGMAETASKLAPTTARHGARYGWMLVLAGQLDLGVRVLRDARLRDPADGRIRWQLAEALQRAGKSAEARDELRAALASGNPPRPGPELDRLRQQLGV